MDSPPIAQAPGLNCDLAFPTAAASLRWFAEDVADALRLPVEVPALLMLPVFSAAAHHQIRLYTGSQPGMPTGLGTLTLADHDRHDVVEALANPLRGVQLVGSELVDREPFRWHGAGYDDRTHGRGLVLSSDACVLCHTLDDEFWEPWEKIGQPVGRTVGRDFGHLIRPRGVCPEFSQGLVLDRHVPRDMLKPFDRHAHIFHRLILAIPNPRALKPARTPLPVLTNGYVDAVRFLTGLPVADHQREITLERYAAPEPAFELSIRAAQANSTEEVVLDAQRGVDSLMPQVLLSLHAISAACQRSTEMLLGPIQWETVRAAHAWASYLGSQIPVVLNKLGPFELKADGEDSPGEAVQS